MKIQVTIDIELPDFKHTESDLNTMIEELFPTLQEKYKNRFKKKLSFKIEHNWIYSEADTELFLEGEDE